MTPLLLLACAGTPSSLLAPTLSADRWDQAALLPPTWTVCPGTGDFDTIQDAIDAASDRDTIEVCTGTYDEDIVIEKPLRLITDGGTTTINGSGTTSVVSIDAVGLVTIEGFVIQGGTATNGGGIHAKGSRLTVDLQDNVVQRNTATEMGGGIYVESIDGSFTDNVFQLNVADMGGGIASMNSDVTFQGNHIRRNDCTTTDTRAYGSGGGGAGVFVQGGGNIIDNSIHANDSSHHGGGAFIYSAYGAISGNRVYDNTSAGDGGGFFFTGSAGAVTGNELYRNQAGNDGGAMHADNSGLVIQDNDFHDNEAAGDGGALQLVLLNVYSTVRGNTFENNVAGDRGGALQLDNDDLQRISRSTFIGNRAARGGALHSCQGLRPTVLSRATFEDNSATECGGAIATDNDPNLLVVNVASITGNTAPNGAAFCMTHEWKDDAMTEADRSWVLFLNALLVDNAASAASGAFHVEFGSLEVRYSTIVGSGRGTLSVGDGDSVSITRTIFADGAGPFADVDGSGTVALTSSLFWNNRGGWGDIGMPIGFHGNISGDPMFVDPANGDFTLDPSSPASGAAPSGTDIGKTGGLFGW